MYCRYLLTLMSQVFLGATLPALAQPPALPGLLLSPAMLGLPN